MCGIVGQIAVTSPVACGRERMGAALAALRHRGPDDCGALFGNGFAFGHTRLSIIDLSPAGRQPMVSEDGTVTLVFNGEIYNHRELRGELEARGYRFRSSSDSEVLLNGLHCHGRDFLLRTNGMFALAAHDARTGRTLLARDRLGIKPLLYAERDGRLTFASEPKGIFALEPMERRLNLDAVVSYFAFRHPVQDDSFFEGIRSLPPAHVLEAAPDGVRLHRYWDPAANYAMQAEDRGEAHYIRILRELTASSVQLRLAADVPVGSILSGGVDSSIITDVVARERQVNTYTIGYETEGYNEFAYAGLIAEAYGTSHHEIRSGPERYREHLERLIRFKDAPLSIPNEPTQFELMRRLRQDITVVLAGTGADEIFYGYGRIFRAPWDLERWRGLPDSVPERAREGFVRRWRERFGNADFSSEGTDPEVEHFLSVYRYTSPEQMRELLDPGVHPHVEQACGRQRGRVAEIFGGVSGETAGGSYLDRMGYAFLKLHLPGILMHNDITSMATSVELRVPFLDHRLVEFALSVPEHHKLRWHSPEARSEAAGLLSGEISEIFDTPKHILREAFRREIPAPVLARRKVGFPVPLHEWFGGGLGEFAREVLLDGRALGRGLYNEKTLRGWLDGGRAASHSGDERTYQFSAAGKLWMVLNLELFLRSVMEGGGGGPDSVFAGESLLCREEEGACIPY